MKRSDKEAFVEDFKERLDKAQLMLVTNFIGLDVASMNELRGKLHERNADYQVVKNNLVKIACEGTPLEELKDLFVGPNAVALAYDEPVETTKVFTDFAKTSPKLELKAGVLDGKVIDKAAIEALANMPSKEVLLAQFLGVIQAPTRNMVSLLGQVPRSVLNVLKAKADADEQAA